MKNMIFIITGIIVILFIFWIIITGMAFRFPGRIEFFLHKRKYEAVVAIIQKLNLPLGTDKLFSIDYSYNISSIKESSEQESFLSKRKIKVWWSGKQCFISLVIMDSHIGHGGYIYADVFPILNEPNEPEYRIKKMNKNWYSFYSSSN